MLNFFLFSQLDLDLLLLVYLRSEIWTDASEEVFFLPLLFLFLEQVLRGQHAASLSPLL